MDYLLKRSLEEHLPIRMIYIDEEGAISDRVVRVIRMERESLLGYCSLRREIRSFRVDRILALSSPKQKRSHLWYDKRNKRDYKDWENHNGSI